MELWIILFFWKDVDGEEIEIDVDDNSSQILKQSPKSMRSCKVRWQIDIIIDLNKLGLQGYNPRYRVFS